VSIEVAAFDVVSVDRQRGCRRCGVLPLCPPPFWSYISHITVMAPSRCCCRRGSLTVKVAGDMVSTGLLVDVAIDVVVDVALSWAGVDAAVDMGEVA